MQLLEFDESKAEAEEAGEEEQDDKSKENKKGD
jgi:minor histocompatibility antigen H13